MLIAPGVGKEVYNDIALLARNARERQYVQQGGVGTAAKSPNTRKMEEADGNANRNEEAKHVLIYLFRLWRAAWA